MMPSSQSSADVITVHQGQSAQIWQEARLTIYGVPVTIRAEVKVTFLSLEQGVAVCAVEKSIGELEEFEVNA